MKTSETLFKAADFIETFGWIAGTEGWVGTPESGYCLEGAIGAALGAQVNVPGGLSPENVNECPAGVAVREYLGEALDPREWLCHWNDFRARTPEDVIGLLRTVGASEEAKENAEVKVLEPVR